MRVLKINVRPREEFLNINVRPRKAFTASEKGLALGSPGLSAYEIALINGFDGTEEEWLQSIKSFYDDDIGDLVQLFNNNLI